MSSKIMISFETNNGYNNLSNISSNDLPCDVVRFVIPVGMDVTIRHSGKETTVLHTAILLNHAKVPLLLGDTNSLTYFFIDC